MATDVPGHDPAAPAVRPRLVLLLRRLVAQWLGSSVSVVGLLLLAAAAMLAIGVR